MPKQEPCDVPPELYATYSSEIILSCGQCGYQDDLGIFITIDEVLESQKKHKEGTS